MQHDVVRDGVGVTFRVLVVSDNSPDLLGRFCFVDVVSPQYDCGIPGSGSRVEKGEDRLGLTCVPPLSQAGGESCSAQEEEEPTPKLL